MLVENDWVTKRHYCRLDRVLQLLHTEVRKVINLHNSLDDRSNIKFVVGKIEEGRFLVKKEVRDTDAGVRHKRDCVEFRIEGDYILVVVGGSSTRFMFKIDVKWSSVKAICKYEITIAPNNIISCETEPKEEYRISDIVKFALEDFLFLGLRYY